MGLMTYLSKDRHGTYYFRKAIPHALRPFMPGERKRESGLETNPEDERCEGGQEACSPHSLRMRYRFRGCGTSDAWQACCNYPSPFQLLFTQR